MTTNHSITKHGPITSLTSFYELSAPLLDGRVEPFKGCEGRITLVVNIATCDFNARNELRQLNELVTTYESKGFKLFAFPCNQFDNGEPYLNDEIPAILRHVRPGAKFDPKFNVFAKCDVNGLKANPVFEFLKMKLPRPENDDDVIISRDKELPWSPVRRSDIGWNYEKFLINYDGNPVKRYTHKVDIEILKRDIEYYQKKVPRNIREIHGIH